MMRRKKFFIAIILIGMLIPLYYSLSHIFTTLPVSSGDTLLP